METWFTSDCHFNHTSIMKHCPNRQSICNASSEDDIEAWNEWLIKKWNDTVEKKDNVYILGDFSFGNIEDKKRVLQKLKGFKHLIVGNHDTLPTEFTNYFKDVSYIKEIRFKKKTYEGLLEEDFRLIACHYPMITWPSKHYGVCHIHGHSHGKMDFYNDENFDLRVDVGIDGNLCKYNFITMPELYKFFKEKAEGKLFVDYVTEKRQELKTII